MNNLQPLLGDITVGDLIEYLKLFPADTHIIPALHDDPRIKDHNDGTKEVPIRRVLLYPTEMGESVALHLDLVPKVTIQS